MSRMEWGPSRYMTPIESVQYRPNVNVSELPRHYFLPLGGLVYERLYRSRPV
jgi:hypothetical protein